MKKKLQSNSGETLVETLFAMLVVVLATAMIAGAVVTASRINKKGRDLDTAFHYSTDAEKTESKTVKVKVIHKNNITDSTEQEFSVTAYQTNDKNQYIYYEYNKPEETSK